MAFKNVIGNSEEVFPPQFSVECNSEASLMKNAAMNVRLLVLPLSLLASAANTEDRLTWKQFPETLPLARTATAHQTPSQATSIDPAPAPWIWGPDFNREYRLTKEFKGGVKNAVLVAACDNHMAIFLNGRQVTERGEWHRPVWLDVSKEIKEGDNELVAVVRNEGGAAGFSCRLVLVAPDDSIRIIESDESWLAAENTTPPKPAAVRLVAQAGDGPWGQILRSFLTEHSLFRVPEGFRVERLFVVPSKEMGSWVALTADPKGRLIASDQGKAGLVRITPAALDGSRPTLVEKIPIPITAAQGLVWAFDSLYVVCNGGPGSGLYRVTDSDGDDSLDKVDKLRAFEGEGEHGPHNVILSPDGSRLFVICGNHTKLPFVTKDVTPPQTMAGVRENQRRVELPIDGASRVPANWDEDQIIRRMWDANGHATGVLAPGGYVASTDPEGKTWEVWSTGYRNPYDFAFNAEGDLFAYDADMEWDFGTPWYRPTRVNHATSGSELGWRSGSGKWPACFPDSLPALVNIGPGSPVGVTFGYGTRFPAKYQRALYVCDWTFGTMYAIHLTADGSTYRGIKEEFVARTPLPLTDVTIGKDGAMYFIVGGRGAQSELYRVCYSGAETTGPVDPRSEAGAAERRLRRELEGLHGKAVDPAAAVAKAFTHLGSPDRFIRYAARAALEHQPISLWQDKVIEITEPRGAISAAIALARQGDRDVQAAIFTMLDRIDPGALDTDEKIDLARAYELAIVRLGSPPAEVARTVAGKFGPLLPSGHFDFDRQLSSLLVGVRAPGIVTKLVGMLAAGSTTARSTNIAPDEKELLRLIDRNSGYGAAVKSSLENRADLLQVHYAYVLRTVTEKEAWNLADRKGYHEWFTRARAWSGGSSYRRFLTNMENESLAALTANEKLGLETQGVLKPYIPPALPKPDGPGRTWTVEEVLAAVAKPGSQGLAKGRDFERGKRTFSAARCIVCHRYREEGGATGPDLTHAAGRFQVKDLIEAIVHPSKVVSDQYRATIVQTTGGRVVIGRIVVESPEKIIVITDPEDATKFVEVPRSDIEEIIPASESLMPKGLLDQLNEQEVLDLLAYTLCWGNPNDTRFIKE